MIPPTSFPSAYPLFRDGRSCTMIPSRRAFLSGSVAAATMAAIPARAEGRGEPRRNNRIGVSTYSFWQFKNADLRPIDKCIDLAADMGFDGVELLHRQMEDE